MNNLEAVLAVTNNLFSKLNYALDFEKALRNTLKKLGEEFELDYAYLVSTPPKNSECQLNFKAIWYSNEIDCRECDFKLNESDDRQSLLLTKLKEEGFVQSLIDGPLFDVASHPFPVKNSNCYLLLPIYANLNFWGVLGFGYADSSNAFQISSIEVLKGFTNSLGALIFGKICEKNCIESNNKYNLILENIRDVVFILNFQFEVQSLNGGWERLSGFSVDESLNKSILLFFEETYQDYFSTELKNLTSSEMLEVTIDLPLSNSMNLIRWVRVSIKHSPDSHRELLGTIIDIHQNKLNSDLLNVNHKKFDFKFIDKEGILYIGDPNSRSYPIVSEKISKLGLSQEFFLNNPTYLLDIAHPDDLRKVKEFLAETWERESLDLEYRIINENGLTLWVANKTWMEYDSKGKPFRLHGVFTDITSSKTREIQLLESEERFKTISENLLFPLLMCSLDCTEVLYINELFLNLITHDTSYIAKEFNIDDYVSHPDPTISVRDYIVMALEIDNLEVLVHEADGDVWYSLTSQRVSYQDGYVLVIILYKIHKRKLAELERGRLEEALHALNYTQVSFSMDVEVQETYSKLLSTLLFFTKSEYGFLGEVLYDDLGKPYLRSNAINNVRGNHSVDTFIDRHLEKGFEFRALDNLIGKVLLSGKPLIANSMDDPKGSAVELPLGHPRINRFLGIPIYQGENFIGLVGLANKDKVYTQEDLDFLQPFMSSYANLISLVNENKHRLLAEGLRVESENLYKILSDNVDDIVSLHDLELGAMYVSPSIERVTGFSPEILLGSNFFKCFTNIIAADVDFTKHPKFVAPVIHKSTGKTIQIEMIWKPLYNEEGALYSFLATSRDVTERESVLVRLRETLDKERELNQLKSKFISMTSHEFRTPLATIISSKDLLERIINKQDDNEFKAKSLRHIDKINIQLNRLNNMVSDVLMMEQNSNGGINLDLDLLNFKEVIMGTLYENFSFDLENPCICIDFPSDSVLMKSDRTCLSYIVKNVIENSIKYSKGSIRKPSLVLRKRNGLILLRVQDFGLGIPSDEIKFIFDPFYRASNTDGIKGTGLGLSIVNELVLKLAGKIKLRSKEFSGTTITILFPYEKKDYSSGG